MKKRLYLQRTLVTLLSICSLGLLWQCSTTPNGEGLRSQDASTKDKTEKTSTNNTVPEALQVQLLPDTLFAAQGGDKTLAITANHDWEVKLNADWLLLAELNGKGNAQAKLTAKPNEAETARTAILIVKAGSQQRVLQIAQKGNTPASEAEPSFETKPASEPAVKDSIGQPATISPNTNEGGVPQDKPEQPSKPSDKVAPKEQPTTPKENNEKALFAEPDKTKENNNNPPQEPEPSTPKEPAPEEKPAPAPEVPKVPTPEANPSPAPVNPTTEPPAPNINPGTPKTETSTSTTEPAIPEITGTVKEQEEKLKGYHYKLPIIFHVMHWSNEDPNANDQVIGKRLQEIVEKVNLLYAGKIANRETAFYDMPTPNDVNVSFELATHTPDGQPLAIPGLHRLPSSARYIVVNHVMNDRPGGTYYNASWDRNKYINVFIYHLGFYLGDKFVQGISHLPYMPMGYGLEGLETYNADHFKNQNHCISLEANEMTWSRDNYSYGPLGMQRLNRDAASLLAHELGHYLGLFHVFNQPGDREIIFGDNTVKVNNCKDTDYCTDTPSYDRDEYDRTLNKMVAADRIKYKRWGGVLAEKTVHYLFGRTACDGTRFPSTNIMDYNYTDSFHFTPQQVARMRKVLMYSPSVPGPKVKVKQVQLRSMVYPKARVCVCGSKHYH